jgi:hypothetical protein
MSNNALPNFLIPILQKMAIISFRCAEKIPGNPEMIGLLIRDRAYFLRVETPNR